MPIIVYAVQIGFGPGDWDVHSEWPDRQKATEICNDLRGTVRIARYPFPLPVRVVRRAYRGLRRTIKNEYLAPAPALRKAAR